MGVSYNAAYKTVACFLTQGVIFIHEILLITDDLVIEKEIILKDIILSCQLMTRRLLDEN